MGIAVDHLKFNSQHLTHSLEPGKILPEVIAPVRIKQISNENGLASNAALMNVIGPAVLAPMANITSPSPLSIAPGSAFSITALRFCPSQRLLNQDSCIII